jgi:hypothetical protein
MTQNELNRFRAILTAIAELERVTHRRDALTIGRRATIGKRSRRLHNAHSRLAVVRGTL